MKRKTTSLLATLLCLIMAASLVPIPTAFAAESPQAPPRIAAPAAILMDFETGEILFERDAHTLRAPASMTKAMTAFVIYEEIEAGRLALDTRVRVNSTAARVSTDENMQGSRLPLRHNSYITVDTMLHLIMLPSSNGACVAMAYRISGSEAAFAERMNQSARAIGMTAYFTNSHGALPHYTTAYSMGILLREFIYRYPDILRVTSAESVMFGGVNRLNTNLLIRQSDFYFRYADGFRTGTTREAGFCLASTAYRDGRRVVSVVMGANNNQERYGDSIALLEWGLQESARRYAERAEAERIEAEREQAEREEAERIDAEREQAERERELAARVTVVLHGEELALDVPARIVNSRVMVPLEVFEAVGAEVNQDGDVITVLVDGGCVIILTVGEYFLVVGDRVIEMDAAPMVSDDTVVFPLRFVAEATGYSVRWDEVTRTVFVEEAE